MAPAALGRRPRREGEDQEPDEARRHRSGVSPHRPLNRGSRVI